MSSDNFFAGFVSGISQTIVGHPFDTVKTIKQNNKRVNFYCISKLYNGISMPLAQTPLVVGVGFYTNDLVRPYSNNPYVSGSISGFVGSFFICPFEYYKINLQQQSKICINGKGCLYSFKHLHLVALREIPSMTLYFGTYETLRNHTISPFYAGGISGMVSWLFTYPLDTIKTRIQGRVSSNIKEALKMGSLFSGITLCMIRAFIVNSVGFYTYEKLLLKREY